MATAERLRLPGQLDLEAFAPGAAEVLPPLQEPSCHPAPPATCPPLPGLVPPPPPSYTRYPHPSHTEALPPPASAGAAGGPSGGQQPGLQGVPAPAIRRPGCRDAGLVPERDAGRDAGRAAGRAERAQAQAAAVQGAAGAHTCWLPPWRTNPNTLALNLTLTLVRWWLLPCRSLTPTSASASTRSRQLVTPHPCRPTPHPWRPMLHP